MHESAKRMNEVMKIAKGTDDLGEIAILMKETPQTVKNWHYRGVSRQGVIKLFELIGASPSYIKDGELPMFASHKLIRNATNMGVQTTAKSRRRIPVMGEIQSDDDGFLEHIGVAVGGKSGYVNFFSDDTDAYALRVRGDNMHPRYRAGEFIIFEPNVQAQPGDDVLVALNDGRSLIRELNWMRDGELQLLPIGRSTTPMTIQEMDVKYIHYAAHRASRNTFEQS